MHIELTPPLLIAIFTGAVTWFTWVTNRLMGTITRKEYETARVMRDEQISSLMANIATKEAVSEVKKDIHELRETVILMLTDAPRKRRDINENER